MVIMTRKVMFSSAFIGPNQEMQGHNYGLEVSVQGEISPITGIIVNIKEIDKIIKAHIVHDLDKKCLNRQVPALCGKPITPESLLLYIADKLSSHLPKEVTLFALRLEETPLSYAEWHPQTPSPKKETGTMLTTRVYEFAASHRLHSPHLSEAENKALFGKCNYTYGHGHNYLLEITIAGPVAPETGQVMETTLLDTIVHREVVDRYDHHHFNHDIPEFQDKIPSSEVIVKVIWERLQPQFTAPVCLYRVLLRETDRNIFEYYGEEH